MSKTAIVILNWNGEKFLEKFLPQLLSKTTGDDVEFVVADNDSKDNSLNLLREKFPSVRIIELEKNHGFAGGYNKALKQIDSCYYLILNSDIEVEDGWLPPLVDFLDKNKGYAACMPSLLDYNNKGDYEYAGAAGGYIDKWGYAFCRGRLFGNCAPYDPSLTEPMDVFWTTGACMLIRSEAFHNASGFDSDFFAHMEEIDLCWRLKNKGQKLAIVPEAKAYHVGGGTLPKNNPFKTFLNFRNNLFLLYKNLPDNTVNRILRKRMLLDGISGLMFLATFRFKDFRAVIKAHNAFRKEKKRYEAYRLDNSMANNDQNHIEIYQKSIVADYFLMGKKKFGQLRDGYPEMMNTKFNTI